MAAAEKVVEVLESGEAEEPPPAQRKAPSLAETLREAALKNAELEKQQLAEKERKQKLEMEQKQDAEKQNEIGLDHTSM